MNSSENTVEIKGQASGVDQADGIVNLSRIVQVKLFASSLNYGMTEEYSSFMGSSHQDRAEEKVRNKLRLYDASIARFIANYEMALEAVMLKDSHGQTQVVKILPKSNDVNVNCVPNSDFMKDTGQMYTVRKFITGTRCVAQVHVAPN